MVMESGLRELSGMMSGLSYDDFYSDENIFRALGFGESQPSLGHGSYFDSAHMSFGINPSSNPTSSISTNAEVESNEDSDIFYSDMALNYISRMLMEEDIDEKVSSYKVESALRATEKPFYDILGQKYPPSPDHPLLDACQISGIHHHRSIDRYMNLNGGVTSSSSAIVDSRSICDPSDYQQSRACASSNCDSSDYQQSRACAGSVEYSSPTPSISSNSINSIEEPFTNTVISPNMFFGSMPAWHFKRGVEEAKKFLPTLDKLVINVESKGASSSRVPKRDGRLFNVKAETEKDSSSNSFSSRVRKNPNSEDLDLAEGRSNKQSTVSSDAEVRSEMFDMILLWQGENCSKKMSDLQEAMQNEASKNAQIGLSSGGKSRGKKHTKKEVVDLRTLLILCAQAVATDDRHTANELLKQIRQHSSPNGDGSQRLAYCFADGLEARLAGTGSQIYRALVAKRTTATDILKAYHLYLAACPFKRISHFFSNQTILNLAEKASKVHIIDFGIYFGFQWPCLIQRLSTREGGPPKLRITGIDVPQPGFRPTERIEETGRRLADYAKSFNVPFEYQAIASKWETIRAEDLHIAKDEVVVVNCLYRFRNLIDETVVVDSPRNRVLNTIRRMNPDVFIHGVVNGSYSAPFFVTRFREALFHYSALFDMLEANVPRDDEQRSLIEKDLFGREALNVIACEGSERVERPETYKQWQVRNFRAGFVQLPLDPDIMKKAKDKVKGSYHKDFVIDEDSRWLIQGWKGRIIYAISAWKPSGA